MKLEAKSSGPPKKKGRPIKNDIDPNAAHLTEVQKRVLSRRKANRHAMQKSKERRKLIETDILDEVSELQKANKRYLIDLELEAAGFEELCRLHRELAVVYLETVQTQHDLLAQFLVLRNLVASTSLETAE